MTLKEAVKVAESVVEGMGLKVLSVTRPDGGAAIFLDHPQRDGNGVTTSFEFKEGFDSRMVENLTRNAVYGILAKYADQRL
jgi:hypothetical protein